MDAETTGFLIDGKVYELPTLDSLTLDEGEILYERSGLVQEDFGREADEDNDAYEDRVSKLMRHPGFWASLMQIAYQRGNPTAKAAHVKLVLGRTNRLEALSALAGADEEDADETPLGLTSEPHEASLNDSLESDNSTKDSNATSGNAITNDSDEPDDPPAATTALRLGTSFTSAQKISAA